MSADHDTASSVRARLEAILGTATPGKAISAFQNFAWEIGDDFKPAWLSDLVLNLAYDLDFYVEDETDRREDPSYYGPERLQKEVRQALGVIHSQSPDQCR